MFAAYAIHTTYAIRNRETGEANIPCLSIFVCIAIFFSIYPEKDLILQEIWQ